MTINELRIQQRVRQYFSEQVKLAFPDFPISKEEMDELALRYNLDEILFMVKTATEKAREKKKP